MKIREFIDNIRLNIYLFMFDVGQFPSEVKYFIQRGRRGYSEKDAWSLDWYINSWLPEALRELSNNVHGCPEKLYDKNKKDDECHRWKKILIEIAEGFEAVRKVDDDDPYNEKNYEKRYKAAEKKLQKSFKLLAKYYGNLWD